MCVYYTCTDPSADAHAFESTTLFQVAVGLPELARAMQYTQQLCGCTTRVLLFCTALYTVEYYTVVLVCSSFVLNAAHVQYRNEEFKMPVVVAANTKGGSGKSTSSLILGTTLAKMGATVRILDADPQKTLVSWSAGQSKYRDIVTAPKAGADLSDFIDEISAEYQFVIIDVQGSANQELAAAMSRADLVTIPMRAKTADAEVAANAIGLLTSQQKLFRRSIAHGVVFIATNPVITTKEERHIRESVKELGIPCFQTSLHERTAFSHMFRFKVAIDELSSRETNGLEAALENADNYANEIVATLRKARKQEAAA